jgi:hypothetical protein
VNHIEKFGLCAITHHYKELVYSSLIFCYKIAIKVSATNVTGKIKSNL